MRYLLVLFVSSIGFYCVAQNPTHSDVNTTRGDLAVQPIKDLSKGFYPEFSERIPLGVQKSTKSVFRIAFLAMDPERGAMMEKWDDHDTRMKSIDKDSFLYSFLLKSEKEAKEAKLPLCPIAVFGTGSAFLLGDGTTLATVIHNTHHTLFGVEWEKIANSVDPKLTPDKIKKILKLLPPFLLFDGEGKIIFDSRLKTDVAEVAWMPAQTADVWKGNWTKNGKGDFDTLAGLIYADIIVLRLKRKIGEGIPFTTQNNVLGDPVFAAGFPGSTNNRKKDFGAIDSDGFSRRITIGKTQGPQELAISLGITDPPKQFIDTVNANFLIGDQDSIEGMSGGPTLNGKGEVLSITSNGIRGYQVQIHPAIFRKMVETGPKRFLEK